MVITFMFYQTDSPFYKDPQCTIKKEEERQQILTNEKQDVWTNQNE